MPERLRRNPHDEGQGRLQGPYTEVLPNDRYVDTENKRSNVIDFTVPVDGYESPWRMAQIVYVYDRARPAPKDVPRSIPALLRWAKRNPRRRAHPMVRNFLGSTFLKLN